MPNSAGSELASSSEDNEPEGTLFMVSVTETSAEDEEEYRTPPERHSHTLTSSNEARMGDYEGGGEDEVSCGGSLEDMEKAVDLSRDSQVHSLKASSVVREEDGFGEVTRGVQGRVEECIEHLLMEEGGVPSSACRGACKGKVELVVEGNHGSSVNADEVNEFQCLSKDEDSFCTGNKGDGATGICQGICWVRTDNRDDGVATGGSGARTCGGSNSAAAKKGVNEQGIGDADDANGKKPSQTSEKEEEQEEEPTEDELTKNILKVLGLLAKQLRPVYNEKVDTIGSSIKAGVTFPRASWWPEDSDDDSD